MSEAESRLAPVGIDREYSRRNFLKTAAAVGTAISAAGVVGFGVAERYANAADQPYKSYEGLGDVAILQFAYLLEQLEGVFYQTGADAGIFDGNTLAQIAAIRDHEIAHAEAIAATLGQLGAEVPATPQFTFPDGVFGDPAAFLKLAATFEPVGIGAYQGAAPALESKDILAAAISIHNAECQHRCAINILSGVNPPNDKAFEDALPLQKVQDAVKPFGITG
ncbi:MAG TPA: ferritin-like domain-containing protein [Rubrobacteraceae bacterium]|nr:ferritin-like domain-containing protein [Rubrobacteraceae bacterium]